MGENPGVYRLEAGSSDPANTLKVMTASHTIRMKGSTVEAGSLDQAGADRRRWRGISSPAWLMVLVFVLSLPAITPRLYAADEIEYFAYLRSWWFDRDVSFDNEYRYFYDRGIAHAFGFRETFLELQTKTGLRLNFATIGCGILWAPFYAVADLAVAGARRFGSGVAADGFSQPYLAAVTYGSAVYGFLAVLISASVAHRVVGRRTGAAVLVWLSTPLLFYMYVAPGMAHACSAFVVAAFVAVWLRVRDRWSVGGIAALAALGALMAMVREQDVLLGIGPAVDLAATLGKAAWERRGDTVRRLVGGAVAGAVVFGVVYLPQALAYLELYGHVGPAPQVSSKMTWTAPHAIEVLLSPEHGFFYWTPLAVLALIGLVWLALRPTGGGAVDVASTRWIGLLALLMVAAQIYVNGSIESWTQAGAFGQRRFVGLTVLLVLGVAQVLSSARARAPRVTVAVFAGLCLWWNLGLMAQFGAGMMDRQRLQLQRNAYNTFVTVPLRIPELAYRYLFNRGSFYQQPQR